MGGMLYLSQDEIKQAVQSYELNHSTSDSNHYSAYQLENLRRAAVIILLFENEGQWHVLLTQRSEALDEHRGQVAFPGGAREAQDQDLQQTALREMREEVGVKPQDVQVFGHLSDMPILTGYLVRVFVGQMPWPYNFTISYEVQSIFAVPLAWLADPKNRTVQYRSFAGREYSVVFFDHYDGYQLWGASAEMTLTLLSALKIIT
jgi:8-oxo-dGTP pyrophosphatase MutT (NUDIX family)